MARQNLILLAAAAILALIPLFMTFEGEEIFGGEYAYFSSFSDAWLKHAASYVDMIAERLELNEQSQVIEVASEQTASLPVEQR